MQPGREVQSRIQKWNCGACTSTAVPGYVLASLVRARAGGLSAARTRGRCGRGQVAYRRLGHVGGRGRGQVAYRRLGHARGRGRGQVVYLDYRRLGDATT